MLHDLGGHFSRHLRPLFRLCLNLFPRANRYRQRKAKLLTSNFERRHIRAAFRQGAGRLVHLVLRHGIDSLCANHGGFSERQTR